MDNHKYEIFSILNLRSVQTWTSVILAGKCDSLRHSTNSFGGNILVAETSYQMLEDLSFWNWEIYKTTANFSGKKKIS